MEFWYEHYWSQAWYANTFLVNKPFQIGRVIRGEWNNIYDSGCNFTCLAMIIGMDPAQLASAFAEAKAFQPDPELWAKRLNGKLGYLVWDRNAPNDKLTSVLMKKIWHSGLGRRVNVQIEFVRIEIVTTHNEARSVVESMHAAGLHVICGPEEHSHLVAGMVQNNFYVWDPDDTETSVERNLMGEFTLRKLFSRNRGKPIECCAYRATIT